MYSDLFIFELFIFFILLQLAKSSDIFLTWYISGIYLLGLGFILFHAEGDIWVGFLWVIDLGVGLVFFIFMLHFNGFLTQKIYITITKSFFLVICSTGLLLIFIWYILAIPGDLETNYNGFMFFLISWYNYYEILQIYLISDLNLIKEIYFLNNSFEFISINYMIIYGLFSILGLSFSFKRLYSYLHYHQFTRDRIVNKLNTINFIRNQNILRQTNQSTGSRVWEKKSNKLNL